MASDPPRLSVVLITRDEEPRIGATLDSVAFADERIVLDHGSRDRTCEIAAARGAQVHRTDVWPGFGPQKNRAVALATGDWILALDADEQVSPALAEEIRGAIRNPQADVYALPRLSRFCGRYMLHSGWWPDRVPRLFRCGKARYSDDQVHERLMFEGPLARLHAPLLHDTHRSIEHALQKMNRYTSLGAAEAWARGKRSGIVRAFIRAVWSFLRTYIFRRGFLDGREGLLLAIMVAENTLYKHAKLAERGGGGDTPPPDVRDR
ncbi:MAG: glycosyltransferase family 2 protein [Planctomycetes bacterium]|nr:glycosyltransferase family 2 protein [Planctomycetota bacterium]